MPDLHYSEADGHLHPCEGCDHLFLHRKVGDMADLNNLCRKCAEECAAQLSIDYNLPMGCSDEERQNAMTDEPNDPVWMYKCPEISCSRYNQTWTTQLTIEDWRFNYGRPPHCFRCGGPAQFVRSWTAGVGSTGA